MAAGVGSAAWFKTLRDQLDGISQPVIEALAVMLVTATVDTTAPQSEARRVALDAIGEHFARTAMLVQVGKGDAYIAVEFPAHGAPPQ